MAPDMWSGWGIRTLSALHPAFNPYNYQSGSIWPHDNALIALGFKRYGFGVEAARIARDISDAASHFLLNELPELYTTIKRDEASFPVQYLGSNIPQAWAAGSVFALMQAMLGFRPDAPRGKLYVDPLSPRWLPDLTALDLRVGKDLFDIRFWRDGEETQFEVLHGDPNAIAATSATSSSCDAHTYSSAGGGIIRQGQGGRRRYRRGRRAGHRRPVRGLRRQDRQLPADRAGVELPGAPLSPPPRDSERQVSVSGGATRELKVRRDAPTQWALAMAVLAVVVGAWLRAFS
jgi:hypothetical protein